MKILGTNDEFQKDFFRDTVERQSMEHDILGTDQPLCFEEKGLRMYCFYINCEPEDRDCRHQAAFNMYESIV
jgi:hypothetical protein